MSGDAGTDARSQSLLRRLIRISALGLSAIAIVGSGAAAVGFLHLRAAADIPAMANPPLAVDTTPVKLEDGYVVTDRFAGRLEPARQTRLAFERGGLVTEVLHDEGQRIAAGAVIARLDTAKLEAERRRLAAQRRELEAKRDLAAFTLKRQDKLKAEGFRSAQAHDEARFGLIEIEAAIERIDAAIAAIDIDIAKSTLRAPFAGTLGARAIDEGTVVSAGTAVADLLESGRAMVRVGVAVDAAARLEAGTRYPLRAGGRTVEGRLTALRPDLATRTRTTIALFEIDTDVVLPFGEIVELEMDQRIGTPGIWVPIAALSEGRKGLWTVFSVPANGDDLSVARETVEILHTDAGRAFVRGTLADGARVVTSGTNRITPGQTVVIAQAR